MSLTRLGVVAALTSSALLLGSTATAGPTNPARADAAVGTDGPRQSSTTTRIQPGVTLTSIERGHPDADDIWTVETAIPAGPGSPDPDAPAAAISDQASAEQAAQRLREAGFDPRVERVVTRRVADFGGVLGYRVRVGQYPDKATADATAQQIRERTDLRGSSLFTGWDPDPDSTGPWNIRVLTVDPHAFDGRLVGSYGPDLERRETTSALAAAQGATAGVNAGFFVFDPAAGAPGDPAGIGLYGGRLQSESVDGRPALMFTDRAVGADVQRFSWSGLVSGDGGSLGLDGVNRVPGLIRNCGGTPDDQPTDLPLHDFTCTDPDEVVRFTSAYGPSTPAGEGVEAVLDERGVVLAVRSSRGGPVPAGGSTVQGTGEAAARLRDLARVGERLRVTSWLEGEDGRRVAPSPSAYVVNGGPELVDDGRLHATPRADGMVREQEPSFYYGWAHKRHPRTIAGVDGEGRLLLVTVDGRSTESLGLSIAESAELARDLGMEEAVNLDGGGSTTMVARGRVVNDPSDGSGERPVGDAVLVLPR